MKNTIFNTLILGTKAGLILNGANDYKEEGWYKFEKYPDVTGRTSYTSSYRYYFSIYSEDKEVRKSLIDKINRYEWIVALFNRQRASIEKVWKDRIHAEQTFEKEKQLFQEDEYVLLYWVLHFGLLGDERYLLLKEQALQVNITLLKDAVALVDFLTYGIGEIQGLNDDFLKQYYQKLFHYTYTHSYHSSLVAYKHSLMRSNEKVYWLVRSANLQDDWKSLHKNISNLPQDKQSLSYILAHNPYIDELEQKKYATKYLIEMKTYIDEYSISLNSFASIYNLYPKIDNLELLKEVSATYFKKVDERYSDQRIVDEFNEIKNYLKDKGVKGVRQHKPKEQTFLELFDHEGYKQIVLSLFPEKSTLTAWLNTQQIGSSAIENPSWKKKKTPQDLYNENIEKYLQLGFEKVSALGELDKKIPGSKRPNIIAKRMTFNEFKIQYSDVSFDQVWWENWQVCVYSQDFISKRDIDLNNTIENVFSQVALIFLGDLTVQGDILNPVLEYGTPIYVKGETTAHSVSAGGAYLHFAGGLSVRDTLVTHYNDGHISIDNFLIARVFFDDDDHDSSISNNKEIDFYYYYHDFKEKGIKRLITKQDLLPFTDKNWIETDDVDYSECENYEDEAEKQACINQVFYDSMFIDFSAIAEEDLKVFADTIEGSTLKSPVEDARIKELEDKVNEVIRKIETLHVDDPKVYEYWNEMASLLTGNETQTLDFLYHLNNSNIVEHISSVFEEIARAFKSKAVIKCFEDLEAKFPHSPLSEMVEEAKNVLGCKE